MTGYMTNDANMARHEELRQRADRRRATHPDAAPVRQALGAHADAPIAIRRAVSDDHAVLERIAALDSATVLTGDILIAHVDDEPQAAIEIATGIAIADPFRPTKHLVELLSLRAALLRKESRSRRRLPRLRPRSAYRAA